MNQRGDPSNADWNSQLARAFVQMYGSEVRAREAEGVKCGRYTTDCRYLMKKKWHG
jgi:hypothetical protein